MKCPTCRRHGGKSYPCVGAGCERRNPVPGAICGRCLLWTLDRRVRVPRKFLLAQAEASKEKANGGW